jgi:predicted DNA-binding transcriptional regulator AlpA
MPADLGLLLHRLAADPTKLGSLTAEQERALRGHLESALGEEPSVVPIAALPTVAPPGPAVSPDDLVTVEEAASMLKVSRRWLYRHAKTWPFTRKLSPKVLRFSRSGMARWMATKRP